MEYLFTDTAYKKLKWFSPGKWNEKINVWSNETETPNDLWRVIFVRENFVNIWWFLSRRQHTFPSFSSSTSSFCSVVGNQPTIAWSNSFSVLMRESSMCVTLNELLMLLNCWCLDRENNMMERQKKMKSCQAFKLINAISKRLYIILIFILFLIVSYAIFAILPLCGFSHKHIHGIAHILLFFTSLPFHVLFAFALFYILLA